MKPTEEADFHEFVTARSSALLRSAFLLCGDTGQAEDLLQSTLTKTYMAWQRLGGMDGSVEAYARRVMVNTATSWWRRRWRAERPTASLPERPAGDATDAHAERDEIWRLLQALPVRQRAVIVLRYYEDLTEADTAALLGLSIGTVKSHTSRAMATLRQRLGDQPRAGRRFAPPKEAI